jgi:Glycine-rich domain
MRFELAGSLVQPDPLVIKFNANANFDTQHYIDLGYTHFEVICIGAGGGMGGGIDTANTGTLVRNYGGAGGGGGFHRVHGLLSALPATCPVVVGVGGSLGTENNGSNPALTTNGGDGGASSFNGTTCQASGGKGGKRAQTNSLTVATVADGGDGGVGNRTIAGGGAAGGVAGTPTATGPGTPGTVGADGTLFQNVGQGGGGGAGGVGKYGSGGTTCNAATAGGRGSYNPGDTAVYGPSDTPGNDPTSGSQNVVPGGASGAKAAPVNGLPTVYGQSKGERVASDPGTVILRLIAK